MAARGHASRSASGVSAALLALAALATLAPAAAEGKLTKPERRAVDINGVSGASTSTALLAEISFAGKLGDALGRGALRRTLVKVELLTASGQTTVITEGGAYRRPRQSRTGTVGSVQVVRGQRSLLLLAEGLPAAVRQVVVSTGTGAAVAARDGVVFDQVSAPVRVIDYQEALDQERQRIEQEIAETERLLEQAEGDSEQTLEQLNKWEQRRVHADSKAERDEARRSVEALKRYLDQATERRRKYRTRLKALRRWHEILGQIRIIVILPLD